MIRPVFLAGIPLLLAVGCADEDGSTLEVVQDKVALSPLSTCAEVETHIEELLIAEITTHFEQMKSGEYYWGWGMLEDGDFSAPTADAGGAGPARDAPNDYSDTNTQEAGIDEADFVKTNGVQTFVLSQQRLYATQTWPPEELSTLGSIELAGYPREMFLTDGDQIVVFANDWREADRDSRYGCSMYGCWGGGESLTRVTVIDASGATLRKRYEVVLTGYYKDSRRIDDAVRIVVGEPIHRPDLQYWLDDAGPDRDPAMWASALDRLLEANIRKIRAADLADFLPQASRIGPDGDEVVLERDCARFHRPNAPVPLGLTTLATLDVEFGTLHRTSVFGESHEAYASTETLYVMSNHWWWRPTAGQTTHTYVHAFDLTSGFHADYRGSFGVPGYLLNQFSMDEHDAHIRIATHVEEFRFDEQGHWVEPLRTNRVTVFKKGPSGFTQTGRTADLAEGERIFSARMEGDRGFVVTFRQVDPLFTLDLSDPTDPHVVGELKVPGFSTYIHFLDDDHLLTIGEHVPEPGTVGGPERGLKLSVFDVTDFANPTEKFVEYIGAGYSEARWDHKAFNYFRARKTLGIPVSRWTGNWRTFVSELQLYEVDADRGIRRLGAVDCAPVFPHEDEWYGRYSHHVRRSVMADDYAYAISDAGIVAAPIANPSRTIATTTFR